MTTRANLPIGNLNDWYNITPAVGAHLNFKPSPKLQIEVEYGYSHFVDGSIEERSFWWPVDKSYHKSPRAEADMTMHWFLVTFDFFKQERSVLNKTLQPFISVGSGLYAFKNSVSGLIYPGQGKRPLDESLLLPPVTDNQVAIGLNFGAGFNLSLSSKISLSFRARYHAILGTIRSFEDWGLKETFPLQTLDLGCGILYHL